MNSARIKSSLICTLLFYPKETWDWTSIMKHIPLMVQFRILGNNWVSQNAFLNKDQFLVCSHQGYITWYVFVRKMTFLQQVWSASNLLRASSLFPRPILADVQHGEFSPLELRINKCFSALRPSRNDLFDHLKSHGFSFSLLHLNLTAKIGEIEHKLRTAMHRADFHDECHRDAKSFLEISNAPQVYIFLYQVWV